MSNSAHAHSGSDIRRAHKKLEMALAREKLSCKFSASCLRSNSESGLYKDTNLPPSDSKRGRLQNKWDAAIVLFSGIFSRSLRIWHNALGGLKLTCTKKPHFCFCFLVLGSIERTPQISPLVYQKMWRCVSSSNRNCSIHRFGVEGYVM